MRSSRCPRHQRPPIEPTCSVGRTSCPLFLIVVALILLPAIAFASPPDPSWVAGLYDDADGDDIVTLLYETAAIAESALSQGAPLARLPEISLDRSFTGATGVRFTCGPRAPPALASTVLPHLLESLPSHVSPASTKLAAVHVRSKLALAGIRRLVGSSILSHTDLERSRP